jgi:hypothetical protein
MKALWLGRFQPPTIAHFASLLKILDLYDEVRIAVVFDGPRPKDINPLWIPVLDQEDLTSYANGKNPFLPEEVIAMWTATVGICRLQARTSCCSIKRPQFFDFNQEFPPGEYMLVSTGGCTRKSLHKAMFQREVRHVDPPFALHNSEIKLLLKNGGEWGDFIAPGAWKVFHSLNGEARFAQPQAP